jgi:hypothetical protein
MSRFALRVMGRGNRPWIDPIEIQRVLTAPFGKEREKDGRLRF